MVDAHSTADDSAQSALHEPTPGGGTDSIGRPARIGRFEVLGVLGAGGMGVVYTAYDPELGRRVAVKVLRERQAEREDRAWREARALARLAHPNVVAIYEVDRHDGRLFLAMELIEGESCDVWLKRQVRSPGEILEVFFQAGQGLAAAHRAGIVHRDFKPSNVIVAVDGRARVVDFGLARGFGDAEPSVGPTHTVAPGLDTTLTRAGGRPGTPRYMSPEQRLGLPIDARSDQYAFCVALFEALAGDVPDETRAHPVFSRRPLRRLHPALVRGLRPDPADRYPTMAELCAALESAMRPGRWPLAALGVGLVGATVTGTVMLRPAAERCDGGAARAEQVWNDARAARFTATITGADADARATLTRAVERYMSDWSDSYTAVCEANARGERSPGLRDLQLACLDQRLGDLDAVLSLLESQAAVGSDVAGALARLPPPEGCAEAQALLRRGAPALERMHPDHAALRQRLAEAKALQLVSRFAEAEAKALAVAEAAAARELWSLEGEAHLLAGEGLADQGQARARARLLEALLHARAHGFEDQALQASTALVRWSSLRAFDIEDARLFAGLARAGLELTGDDGLLRAEALRSLAKVHWLQGDVERMLPMLEEAQEILTRRLGARRPELAAVYLDMGGVLGRLGRPREALEQLLLAKAIYEENFGPFHPTLGRLYFNLSAAYADVGRLEDGFKASSRAIELLAAGGVPAADVAAAKVNLVFMLRQIGRADQALRMAIESDEVLVQTYGPMSLAANTARLAVGESLHDLGRVAEAIGPYRDAWTIRRAKLGEASPETLETRIKYAHALVVEDPTAALALLGDVGALPDGLRGLALLTRAQARVTLGVERDAAQDDARRARALIPGDTAIQAVLHRELDALAAR